VKARLTAMMLGIQLKVLLWLEADADKSEGNSRMRAQPALYAECH